MKTHALVLEALDPLLFRDARPIGPGASAASGLPRPQTIAGALRTALLKERGFDLGAFAARRRERGDEPAREALLALGAPEDVLDATFSGALLCGLDGAGAVRDVYTRVPRVLHRPKRGPAGAALLRAGPSADPLLAQSVRLPGPLRLPVWLRGLDATEPLDGFLAHRGLRAFVGGGVPGQEDLVAASDLYAVEWRTGVGIHPERRAAKEGLLFSVGFLSLNPRLGPKDAKLRVSLYVEVFAPEAVGAALDGLLLKLGGESRTATARRVDPFEGGVARWSGPAKGKGMVLLLQPGEVGPRGLPGAPGLAAASVGRPEPHSGFDLARGGPRATRQLAPAGSVYWFDDVPAGPTLSSTEEGRAVGEATFITAAWED